MKRVLLVVGLLLGCGSVLTRVSPVRAQIEDFAKQPTHWVYVKKFPSAGSSAVGTSFALEEVLRTKSNGKWKDMANTKVLLTIKDTYGNPYRSVPGKTDGNGDANISSGPVTDKGKYTFRLEYAGDRKHEPVYSSNHSHTIK